MRRGCVQTMEHGAPLVRVGGWGWGRGRVRVRARGAPLRGLLQHELRHLVRLRVRTQG
jgi:hypothetical protein